MTSPSRHRSKPPRATARATLAVVVSSMVIIGLGAPAAGATGNVPATPSTPTGTATHPRGPVPLTPAGAPQTIPGLDTWQPGRGSYIALQQVDITGNAPADIAASLSEDLVERTGREARPSTGSPGAGDVDLTVDPSRGAELGEEGYELVVDNSLRVVGATDQAVLHGSQTVLQMLSQGDRIPRGRSVDIPEFAERGLGLCACQMTISMETLERTMKDMAYLKLNQLWLETKIKSDAYPKANFWAYYTREEAAQINAWAKKYRIELVMEVNSPGHMSPWLHNYPELQLVDRAGQRHPEQLDLTKPEALQMVTTLADEYASVVDSPYWHMGGDEYMMGDSYDNYPQFEAYVAAHPEIFPAGSGPGDVFIDFMNKVNAHVRAQGKTLRIWNDGLPTSSKVQLDSTIVVEHWLDSGPAPQQIVDSGRELMNASMDLYFNRPGNFTMDSRKLWNAHWNPRIFSGSPTPVTDVPGKGAVTGAKVSAWPDNTPARTEHQVEQQLFGATRFIAQATWGSPRPVADYDAFTALSDSIGRAPSFENIDRAPVAGGRYAIGLDGRTLEAKDDGVQLSTDTAARWSLQPTPDGYYTISTPVADGRSSCLVMAGGRLQLQAPLDQDLAPTLAPCDPADNLQKWQVLAEADSFTIGNAITQLALSADAQGGISQQASELRPAGEFSLRR